MLGRVQPPLIFFMGIVFCVGLVILPEMLPAISGRDGYVWSPVHSQNYRLGDLYYYGAWLREVLDSGLPAYSPSARELAGQPLIESWRSLGLALAALPGLLISDMRYVIVIDYGLSAALYFTIGYLFALLLARNHWLGLLTGISVLFLTDRIWAPVGPYASNIFGFWQIPASMFWLIINYFQDTRTVVDYDMYGSTFRFINISLTGPIILFTYLITTLAYKKDDLRVFVILCFIMPFMAFSYPSHMVIAYGLLLTYSMVSLYRRKWKTSISFVSIVVINLVFLEIIRYRQTLKELLNNSELWNNIFASEKMVLISHDPGFLASVILTGKYFLTFVFMFLLTRKKPFLRDVVVATGIVAIALSGIYLFEMPQLSTRFLGRGLDHLWFALMIVVTFSFLYEKIGNTNPKLCFGSALKTFSLASFVAVLLFSGYAFGHIAARTTMNNSRFIPESTMEAYRWMDKNIPRNAQVATLDWEDITLLPIFTKVSLVVGHNIIDGRSPNEELIRFVDTYRFLGFGATKLEKLLDNGPGAIRSMRQPSCRERVPCLQQDLFEASQFMEGVLYFPYITKVNNIELVDEKTNAINTEFRQYVLNLYKNANIDEFLNKYDVEYVVINNRESLPASVSGNIILVYNTSSHSIFKVAPTR